MLNLQKNNNNNKKYMVFNHSPKTVHFYDGRIHNWEKNCFDSLQLIV